MQNNIRVFYEKLSRAKYISHLDITRCMQRAVKRAEIPAWHTEGFNPHIYLTFALPLSLGYESISESMDMRLDTDMDLNEVKERFNSALPPDIRVTRVCTQVNKPDKIKSCLYFVTLSGENAEALKKAILEFAAQEKIVVQKRTKRGMKPLDIKPLCSILSAEVIGERELKLSIKAAAGVETTVNPTLLTEEFLKQNGLDGIVTHVIRTAVYMENDEEFI